MKNNIETIKDMEKEDIKRDILISSIENFIETKNRYIQFILLILPFEDI